MPPRSPKWFLRLTGSLVGSAIFIFLLAKFLLGDAGTFLPHGHCYLWNDRLLWMHVISDTLIGLSYLTISISLGYAVYSMRTELPFHWLFTAFGCFIIACGATHFMEVWTVWNPVYWTAGYVKVVTAVASLITAVAVPGCIPRIRELLAANRRFHIQKAELEAEVQRRRKVEAELREAHFKLGLAYNDLESFSYSVSHDLRAPLRHMRGFAELLEKHSGPSLDERGRRSTIVIRESADRMAVLMDQLLAFTRLGQSALRKRKVNLREVAEAAREELRQEQGSRHISWDIRPLPEVEVDPGMLRLVFVNLFSNAIKFTRERSEATIEVGSEDRGEDVAIYVRDNGAGFDEAYAKNLFGVFQRLHGGDQFEGTGIGLANVRRIITLHGGETWAHGVAQSGAVFYFSIPKNGGGGKSNP